MSREQKLEDALNHLLNAVSAKAAPDLMAVAVREAEQAIQSGSPGPISALVGLARSYTVEELEHAATIAASHYVEEALRALVRMRNMEA